MPNRKQEIKKQQKQHKAMNSVTNSVGNEGYQNQEHNTKKEALGSNTKR